MATGGRKPVTQWRWQWALMIEKSGGSAVTLGMGEVHAPSPTTSPRLLAGAGLSGGMRGRGRAAKTSSSLPFAPLRGRLKRLHRLSGLHRPWPL